MRRIGWVGQTGIRAPMLCLSLWRHPISPPPGGGRAFDPASAVGLERLSGLAALTAAGCAASIYIRQAYDQPIFGRLAWVLGGILVLLICAFLPGVLPL